MQCVYFSRCSLTCLLLTLTLRFSQSQKTFWLLSGMKGAATFWFSLTQEMFVFFDEMRANAQVCGWTHVLSPPPLPTSPFSNHKTTLVPYSYGNWRVKGYICFTVKQLFMKISQKLNEIVFNEAKKINWNKSGEGAVYTVQTPWTEFWDILTPPHVVTFTK